MSSNDIDRKLAVIFATDVVGYSKLMEQDEDQTIRTLRVCKDILENLFVEHGGRTFNTAGDSVLAEFNSTVSAVVCAAEFQRMIKERNENNDFKISFRIGINIGDVVKEGENLYGDGVNVAARLESLAQPDGITLSKSVYDLVNKKTRFLFNDLGEQTVKSNKFHAFDVILDTTKKRITKKKQKNKLKIYQGLILIVVLLAPISYFFLNEISSNLWNKNEQKFASQADSLPVIIIKPFSTIGTEDNSISNALTESLVTSLSQYNGVNVLSSSTSFYALNKSMTTEQIKNQFNADYMVAGSAQSFGEMNRITIELNDLRKNSVIWSNKFDFELNDIFVIQDKIGNEILNELQIKSVVGYQAKEWSKEFDTFQKYNLYLNARDEWRKYTFESHKKHIEIMNELKDLGLSQNVIDYMEGWRIIQKIDLGLSQNLDDDLNELDIVTMRHIKNKGDNEAYALRGFSDALYLSKDCNIAKEYIEKAIQLGGSVDVFTIAASTYNICKEPEKSIEYGMKALKLMPNDNGYFVTRQLVRRLYKLDRIDEIETLMGKKIYNEDIQGRSIASMLWVFAAIEIGKGNSKEAKAFFDRGKAEGVTGQYLKGDDIELYKKIAPILKPLGDLN